VKFTYKGVGEEGQPVAGETEADSPEAAKRFLEGHGISVTDLKAVWSPVGLRLPGGVRAQDLAAFCDRLADLTRADMPLAEALGALARDAQGGPLRGALERVAAGLEAGGSLSDLMEKERRAFPPLLVALVRAGEASGNLPETLRLAATHTWRVAALRSRVKAALVYPLVVLLVLFGVFSGILLLMVPGIRDMFSELGVDPPMQTIVLIALSDHYLVFAGTVAGLVVALVLGSRAMDMLEEGTALKRWIAFHVPLLGRVLWTSYLAQFCRTLSLLLASGLTLDRSLELLMMLGRRLVPKRAGEAVVSAVRRGGSLTDAMLVQAGMFPELLRYMVATSERMGRLPEALTEAGDLYEREAERGVQLLVPFLAPVLLVVIAVTIGLLVWGVYGSILSLLHGLA